MADITVITSPTSAGWTCTVQVSEGNGQTRHSVSVNRRDLDQLSGGTQASPELLVRRSFEFLLEREPKESILRQFDLPTITKFFPDYPAEIKRRVG